MLIFLPVYQNFTEYNKLFNNYVSKNFKVLLFYESISDYKQTQTLNTSIQYYIKAHAAYLFVVHYASLNTVCYKNYQFV